MGKRELLIILAFVLAGMLAYQLTAPASEGGSTRSRLTSIIDHFRREVRGNPATATVTTRRTLPVSKELAEARVSGIAHVQIVGEARQDIEYTLTVESNGPDEATARQYAERATLTEDTAGPVLVLRAGYPRELRQVASITLRVPERLSVRVEGAQGRATLEVTGTSGVQLDGVVGDVRIGDVGGKITGTHRNGELTIARAAAVNVTLVSSKATLEAIEGPITVSARNGRCQIAGSTGPIELDATNVDISIVKSAGVLRVRGNGGAIAIDDPRAEVNIDVRRAAVAVTAARPVPMTILTTDAPLSVRLAGPPAIKLDAVTTEGTIDASDFSLTPEAAGDETRLVHSFGTAVAPVALRNRRAPIVIGLAK
jgi:hypothetical protein